ncbi:MAG: helicase-exonuclease AddAB subunit AddA [Oscillibacter sp.]|jgi:ATP-dependent helicase/nuclease subunit A|nr:helicase-exonuclease AddAB subunit AddA [Oscillibacter sp.]
MSELKLTEEQRAAVENRGGGLLVSAAAGSGKTKVLVERLFRYMTQEHCNVDDFLVITYTKAAAAELRGKIASELNRRLADAPEDRHLRAQLLRVYEADIKTVDAFCTALLRENTHLLAREGEQDCLSPDFRVLDEDEAQLLRERVLDRTLETFYGALDDAGRELADTLGFGRDDGALRDLVLEVHQKLQSHAWPGRWLAENGARWDALAGASVSFEETDYARVLRLTAARRASCWRTLLNGEAARMAECPALARGYAGRFTEVAGELDALEAAASGGSWEAARSAARSIVFPKLGPVKDSDGGGEKIRAKKLWDGCRDAVKKLCGLLELSGAEAMEDLAAAAPAMSALVRLTGQFSENYRREKLRRNAADFADQEHLALQLLVEEDGAPTQLTEQVAARYAEVLVDEYQDTNEVQNAIFRAVSRNGRNLFTVGDVKQSIYRFRLADPTIFLQKYAAFRPAAQAEEGEERKILLTKNFRSRREILDAVNFLFENILSPEMGEMVYGEEESLHFGAEYYPERTDCGTEFHLIYAGQKEGDSAPVKRLTAETRFVAGRIRELLDEKFPVTDTDGTLRPCRPEDIVILLRSPGSRAGAYAAALEEREIPCAFDSAEDFFSAMEISVMLSLLEVVDNPRQDVPLISVLRSPVFGFTPDRLAEIRGKTPAGGFFDAVEADGGEDCRAFLTALAELRRASRDMRVSRLIWHIYNTLNVPGIFGAMDRGSVRRENLIALGAHAQRLEGSGYTGLFSFITQLRRLIESGRAPQTASASAGGGVRLMSIHKSKGLEFPIVILTDLDHAFSRQDFDTPVLVHPQLGLGPVRVELERRIQYPTAARMALEQTLRRENRSEEQRILYVAMTRAKEKLILVDSLYHAPTRLARLAAVASCPALPETVGDGKCFGDWILLPLLCRTEAAPLRELAGVEAVSAEEDSHLPWLVQVHAAEAYRDEPAPVFASPEASGEERFDPALLEFVYPYQRAAVLPAKLTATQLKGREADSEIAEGAARTPYLRPLTQPRFRQTGGGLTAAEAGTATHLTLQYLDFSDFDVAGQVEALRRRRLLTDEQAAAAAVPALERFLASPLAEEIRCSPRVLREYPFTVLESAEFLDPGAPEEDRILLQGVVDCCFEAADGTLTVVDFKTDRVFGPELLRRAEEYRPQLEAYARALRRVLSRDVGRKVLCFLTAGENVELFEPG